VRERKGITLKEVAHRACVSESLISQIERNRVSPSIDTLLAIADVLGIDLYYLFSDYRQKRPVDLVRAGQGRRIDCGGARYSELSVMRGEQGEHEIEAFLLEIAPGSEQGSTEYGHRGRELGFILEGEGELHYGADRYDLHGGDCVSFASDIPHLLKNNGRGMLKALWVSTPPKMSHFRE
jgi:transcriptional regulator with XRE-family HTH domain